MVKLGLLTAIWGRPRLTRLFLDYYDLQAPFSVMRAAYSPKDSPADHDLVLNAMNQGTMWTFDGYRNAPLADKWLGAINELKFHDLDAVMIAGSDDFITPDYVEHCKKLVQDGAHMIVPRHIHYYDARTARMMRVRHKRPGAGRVLSASLLERMNWQPWRKGDRNIDGSMDARLRETIGDEADRIYTYIDEPLGAILDVKTGVNMWDYDYLRKKEYVDLDAAAFLPEHFPLIADELLEWNQQTHQI